jgi:hypothetical protein
VKYRVTGFIVMGCLTLGAVGLYLVKYWVQDVKQQVMTTRTALKKERESLHLLGAEWAYLNRPERLKRLSAHYLALQSVKSTQYVAYSQLPEMPVPQSVSAEVGMDASGGDRSAFFQPVAVHSGVDR